MATVTQQDKLVGLKLQSIYAAIDSAVNMIGSDAFRTNTLKYSKWSGYRREIDDLEALLIKAKNATSRLKSIM